MSLAHASGCNGAEDSFFQNTEKTQAKLLHSVAETGRGGENGPDRFDLLSRHSIFV